MSARAPITPRLLNKKQLPLANGSRPLSLELLNYIQALARRLAAEDHLAEKNAGEK
jgi:hypothetical protein